jgi:hypothetical protein
VLEHLVEWEIELKIELMHQCDLECWNKHPVTISGNSVAQDRPP